MTQRNKGLTQAAAATTAGISVRSGRRIEKGQWQQPGERHWRTHQDPLEEVWLSDIFPLLSPGHSSRRQHLSEDDHRDQTERYARLCEHYGMTPSRNNSGRGHENGSVESAHGHLKERIRQALLLRGSHDFGSLDEYRLFVTKQVLRHNQRNQDLVRQELEQLRPLPRSRCADYEELSVRVSSSSTISVRLVVYSVPSRLIGQMLKVRLWDDRLSCYVGSDEVMCCPRVRAPKGKRRARSINFRHVIGSLVRKPGAFFHATLRNDILPDDEWRQLWQHMCSRLPPQQASRLMVNALKLAAEHEDISVVAKGLKKLLQEPGEPDLQKLLSWLGVKDKRPLPDGKLIQHSLQGYDHLMRKGGQQ